MKCALSVTLSFLLFAFTTNFPLAFSDAPQKVLDSKGAPISPSGEYYISQLNHGATGGGLKAGVGGKNATCQVTVLQDFYEAVRGQAVKFSIQGTNSGGIFIDTPLDIAFVDKPACASSSKWVVVADNYPDKWVGIGDAVDHPGRKIINGVFKIQKYLFIEGYKFVFCPTITAVRPCFNIGRREDKFGNRLILINETRSQFIFEVAFDKVVLS